MTPGDANLRLALVATALALATYYASTKGLAPAWLAVVFVLAAFALGAWGWWQQRNARPRGPTGALLRVGPGGATTWTQGALDVPRGNGRVLVASFDLADAAPREPLARAAGASLAAFASTQPRAPLALAAVLDEKTGRAGRLTVALHAPGKSTEPDEAQRLARAFEREFVERCRQAGLPGVRPVN